MVMRTGSTPRKQRTRQHVIADLSANHVERFVLDAGHTVGRLEHDYGYDLNLITYDGHGYVEPGSVSIQLKAAERLRKAGTKYVFDLDIRDYNLWTLELMPVVLVLYDVSRRKAYWVHIQGYFRDDPTRRPKKGAKRVRVRVPRRQPISRSAVARMRALKQEISDRLNKVIDDA
jgi:hypothetical protein